MSTSDAIPWGRFDDFSRSRGTHFATASATITATRLEDVAPAMDELDRATERGWWAFGFVSYEAAPGFDHSLAVRRPAQGFPLLWFGLSRSPRRDLLISQLPRQPYDIGRWRCDWSEAAHRERVQAVRSRIAAGDTYQANLTTRMRTSFKGHAPTLYADLVSQQRGSHNAFINTGKFLIASASPEQFIEVNGRQIHMRPMKGTARRGTSLADDRQAGCRLLSSAKDRAENIMIVDLIRNDLARIADTGSVVVRSLCDLERYDTVYQLTSHITATLRPHTGLRDIYTALFPCGSITGAPKARTMQLIAELEDSPRGIYCGTIGIVGPPGAPFRARFSVAIRTAVIDQDQGSAVYGTGGGITWDSQPTAEYDELLAKSEILRELATFAPQPHKPVGDRAKKGVDGGHEVRHHSRQHLANSIEKKQHSWQR